ncbi:hypothetical protein ACOME3_000661 [Neoechinorhynchus agilis]
MEIKNVPHFEILAYEPGSLCVEECKKNVKANPLSYDALISLAYTYAAQRSYPESIETYITAMEIDPTRFDAPMLLGNLYKGLGELEKARKCFKKIVKIDSSYAPAWNNIGCILQLQGKIDKSICNFEEASKQNPQSVKAFLNLGKALKIKGLCTNAEIAYRNALKIEPLNEDAIISIAASEFKLVKMKQIVETCSRSLKSNTWNILYSLGQELLQLGENDQAEVCFFAASNEDPTDPLSLIELGYRKSEIGLTEEAKALYRRALTVSPNSGLPHGYIAELLLMQRNGHAKEILKHCRRFVNLEPNSSIAHFIHGQALEILKNDFHGAIDCYKRAIENDKTCFEAYLHMADILVYEDRVSDAVDVLKKLLSVRGKVVKVICNCASLLRSNCDWKDFHEMEKVLKKIARKQLGKDGIPAPGRKIAEDFPVQPKHSLMYSFERWERKEIAAEHARTCLLRLYHAGNPQFEHCPQARQARKDKYIRIGYISTNFRNHAATHLMQSIPMMHNRNRFKIYCYALNSSDGSTFRSMIETEADHFYDFSKEKIADAAEVIHSNKIDILVDMNGHKTGSKIQILAMRPAPIQVLWLGYPNTSGASFMDYFITDAVASPLKYADQFSEKMAYMPNSFFIGDHKQMFPHLEEKLVMKITGLDKQSAQKASPTDTNFIINIPPPVVTLKDYILPGEVHYSPFDTINVVIGSDMVPVQVKYTPQQGQEASGQKVPSFPLLTQRSTYGIPDDAFVFCNFNQCYKFDMETMEAWSRILKSVSNSVLWLQRRSKCAKENIIKFFTERSIDKNRLIFTGFLPKEIHVRRGQLADLCLDSPSFNGHTTGMDILWAGTPIITFPMDTLASRVAASQLTALGCIELIANSLDEYEKIAIRLATNQEEFAYIRQKVLKARLTSTLFDVRTYTQNLEKLYERMYQRFVNQSKLDHILTVD